jgi:hypothetical protein
MAMGGGAVGLMWARVNGYTVDGNVAKTFTLRAPPPLAVTIAGHNRSAPFGSPPEPRATRRPHAQ